MLDDKDMGPCKPSASCRHATHPSRPPESFEMSWKRIVDVSVASILLVFTAPVMLVALVLVKATSRGPFIYTQTRLGLNRRRFTIFKIRSMTYNCERFSGPCWSTEDDPRVTPVGRILRRTHLDELPQLWNVLRGDMSLVGPRPERPEFVTSLEKKLPRYAERLKVRPGVTGLAQMKLPPDTDLQSVQCKLVYDLHYVERCRPGLDLRILFGTGLFLLGIPFAISCRLLGLDAEGPLPGHATRPRNRPSISSLAPKPGRPDAFPESRW
jgi:lipopolysaccharide/colanic/teichoic acid biosynthesis glycosyltransferase